MPEKLNDRTIFTLSEVAASIRKTLADRYTSTFWVKAEMNKLNLYPQSGHCYPDLVEKTDGKIVAELRSTIWKEDFQRINASFMTVLHEPLKSGISILLCARISFSPLHGLSLAIIDIDPSYSLGELEREKQQTLEMLRKEGLFLSNKSLVPAVIIKRIAVISVQTSKGFSDFRKVIDGNGWGYRFFYMLFPSLLQGEHAAEAMIAQLKRIEKVRHHFDAVAIIRGGGGDVGLSCYNDYNLAREIAMFPLPVITGIGHSTNETVAEMISFKNAITPTELADYLIQKFHNFSVPVQRACDVIINRFAARMKDEKLRMLNFARYFKSVTLANLAAGRGNLQQEFRVLAQQTVRLFQVSRANHSLILSELRKNAMSEISAGNRQISQAGFSFKKDVLSLISHAAWRVDGNLSQLEKAARRSLSADQLRLEEAVHGLRQQTTRFIAEENHTLNMIEKNVDLMNPVNLLNRGYSITLAGGRVVRDISGAREGAELKTLVSDGEIISIVKNTHKTEQP